VVPGCSATARQVAWVSSFDEPTTKVENVKRGFRRGSAGANIEWRRAPPHGSGGRVATAGGGGVSMGGAATVPGPGSGTTSRSGQTAKRTSGAAPVTAAATSARSFR